MMKKLGLMLGLVLVVLAHPAMAQERLVEGLKVVRACEGDVERLCPGIRPGEGRIKACVKDKLSQLSPGCTEALASMVAEQTEPPPDYTSTAKFTTLDGRRGMRYCEIFLIGGNPITENLYGEVFNTSDLNNKADRLDTCPQAMWDKVNADALKKEYDILGVFKNGPRGWTMDSMHLPVAPDIHTLSGLDTRWYMKVELPKGIRPGSGSGSSYKTINAVRNSTMTFEKGKPVYILDDPTGTPWVMQAYAMIVDPKLTYAELPNLGSKLKLPPGWKYRVKVLDQDLTIKAVNSIAHITQDELQNTYDACFETACTYKP
jgi:hypothetical protein